MSALCQQKQIHRTAFLQMFCHNGSKMSKLKVEIHLWCMSLSLSPSPHPRVHSNSNKIHCLNGSKCIVLVETNARNSILTNVLSQRKRNEQAQGNKSLVLHETEPEYKSGFQISLFLAKHPVIPTYIYFLVSILVGSSFPFWLFQLKAFPPPPPYSLDSSPTASPTGPCRFQGARWLYS